MTLEKRKQLMSKIKSVFSNVPRPTKITDCPCDECQELQRYFINLDSDNSPTWQLRQHETILFHGTAEAFRYFLPLYMIVALDNLSDSGAIPDLIIGTFATDGDRERTRLLLDSEMDCIEEFIDFLIDAGEYDQDDARLNSARKKLRLMKRSDNSN